jgi:uncharacterized protein
MTGDAFPATAAWQHHNSRTGMEVCSFEQRAAGWLAVGCTTAVEAGVAWWVGYEIDLDPAFATRGARITSRVGTGAVSTLIAQSVAPGRWTIDGQSAHALDGCLDIDLESSAMTNALPIRRLSLMVGEAADVPAVYVQVQRLQTGPLAQRYARRPDGADGACFDYAAPAFDFACRIDYDRSGLVRRYPGIAQRLF